MERRRRHYSPDLKRRVIYQSYILQLTSTEIAINLDIPLRVVQRVKHTWNEIGEVCKDRRRLGRAPILSPAHCEVSVDALFMFYVGSILPTVHHCVAGAFTRSLP